MNRLDPSVKAIWAFKIFIRLAVLGLIVLFSEFFFHSKFDFLPTAGLIGLSILIFALFFSIIWPYFQYRYWLFEIRERELYLERGVFTRVKTTAPFVRIQHLDVTQGVFDRMFGLAGLVVYTAGTRGADLVIPGLPLPFAESLRDSLKNFSPEDAV